jgi:hypothetical protein
MTYETREQVLEKVLHMEKPVCPYCKTEMKLWEVPPVNFSDGLGWGEPFLFMCFNDDCSCYAQGWSHMEENMGHKASYRCFSYPSNGRFEVMPVFSRQGAQGQIIDDQMVAQEEALKEAVKRGFSILATCFVEKDGPAVLRILLDPTEPARVRLKAAEMIGDIGEIDAIEPLRNLKTGNEIIDAQLEKSVGNIHARFYTRECPFCAEIIKQRAKVCKHCNQNIAGC